MNTLIYKLLSTHKQTHKCSVDVGGSPTMSVDTSPSLELRANSGSGDDESLRPRVLTKGDDPATESREISAEERRYVAGHQAYRAYEEIMTGAHNVLCGLARSCGVGRSSRTRKAPPLISTFIRRRTLATMGAIYDPQPFP